MAHATISAADAAAWQGRSLIDTRFFQRSDTVLFNNDSLSSVSVAGLWVNQQPNSLWVFINRGIGSVVLEREDSAAPAAERFSTPRATIPPGGRVEAFFDGLRWEVYGADISASPSPLVLPDYAFHGATHTPFHIPSIPAAFQALNTPAVGTKVLVYAIAQANPTAGAITTIPQMVYPGAITRRVANSPGSVGANSIGSTMPTLMVVESGEVYGFTPAGAGLAAWGVAMVVPATSGWKSPKLTTFIAGDNTLYTVPAGKIAYIVAIVNNAGPSLSDVKSMQYTNDSGGTVTVRVAYVPNGAITDLAVHALNGAGNSINNASQLRIDRLPSIMLAGDKIVVNTSVDTNGQWSGMSLFEADA